MKKRQWLGAGTGFSSLRTEDCVGALVCTPWGSYSLTSAKQCPGGSPNSGRVADLRASDEGGSLQS